jgi:hypothetical protein
MRSIRLVGALQLETTQSAERKRNTRGEKQCQQWPKTKIQFPMVCKALQNASAPAERSLWYPDKSSLLALVHSIKSWKILKLSHNFEPYCGFSAPSNARRVASKAFRKCASFPALTDTHPELELVNFSLSECSCSCFVSM